MESVLTAAVVIFLILFTTLTLSQAFIAAQDSMQMSWRDAENRWDERARTDLEPISAQVGGSGDQIDVTLRNAGDTRLADFARWDVIAHYYEAAPAYRVTWLPCTSGAPVLDEWGVAGIYQDAAAGIPETYERSVLNPGEEILLRLRVAQPLATDTTGLISISTDGGVSTSVLVTNP